MKHPGPYQKIAIDRRSFMPISTGKGMARANETTKRVRIILRIISNEKGNGRKGESLGLGQAGAIGANRPWVLHFISAGFGTSKRGWSAGGAGVGLDLHGFDWYDTSCNGALAGRIDIT